MPGPLFHVGATAICPHGGQIATISSNVRVLVSGMPVATMADTSLVAGCVFVVVLKPQPCLRVQWLVPAVRVLVNGQPPGAGSGWPSSRSGECARSPWVTRAAGNAG